MRTRLAVLTSMLALVPALAAAQSPRPSIAPGNTVLLAAFNCAADQLDRADALMKEVAAPVFNKHVASGALLTWGYTGVSVGDRNNRSVYVWAKDAVALMQARQVYLPEITANPKFGEFAKICGTGEISIHNLIVMAAAPTS